MNVSEEGNKKEMRLMKERGGKKKELKKEG